MSLSKRATQAIEIIKKGGFWTHRLEFDSWKGREQFKYRLWYGHNSPVAKIGQATFHELSDAGYLVVTGKDGTSRFQTTYGLKIKD